MADPVEIAGRVGIVDHSWVQTGRQMDQAHLTPVSAAMNWAIHITNLHIIPVVMRVMQPQTAGLQLLLAPMASRNIVLHLAIYIITCQSIVKRVTSLQVFQILVQPAGLRRTEPQSPSVNRAH